MTALLIVDADPNFRAVLARSLERQADLDVVGQASTLSGAVLAARDANPDIVILDAALPDAIGGEVVSQIRAQCPHAGLLLVVDSASGSIEPLPPSGIDGLVRKSAPVSSVVTAVRGLIAESRQGNGGPPKDAA